MAKLWKKIALMAVLMFVILALVAGACAPAPLEKEKTIKVGMRVGFTGAAATSGYPLTVAPVDYVKYLNEQGGIDGMKVKAIWQDNQGQPAKTITAHKRLVHAGVVVS